ncbi:MAG: BON domain-containing protein [Mariprofundaceae bacterium]|nr:BON domain-containing protein [Mariprofundaceae bacterium]
MGNRILLLLVCAGMLSSCVATALVGGGAAVGSVAGDERTAGRHIDDVAIASKIDALLIAEKDMPSRWVSVEVVESVVWLTGYLPSQAHIDRAVHICRTVKGVRDVKSELHIGEPSTGSLFSDSWITTKVKTSLLDDKVVSGFSIHVETVNGKVYLQGIVKNSEQRYRAKDIARNTKGVTAIVDLLQVRN